MKVATQCCAMLIGIVLVGCGIVPAATGPSPLLGASVDSVTPAIFDARIVAGMPSPPAAPPSAAGRPEQQVQAQLPTAPLVDLRVAALPVAAWAPQYIAQERGYFRDVGLNVELVPFTNASEGLPALAQGQLHVGTCANSLACFNALARGTDVQIVADQQSGGKTERSTGNVALVVRRDLWDAGTIRQASDLIGRTVYNPGVRAAGPFIDVSHWLLRNGVDPQSVDFTQMPFPDQFAAMQNGAIEVGYQTEPLISAGLARGAHQVLATMEELHPNGQVLSLAYWSGIERMGPMVGERFMVAYLRGVRDYINAFEYGVDQDAIIDVLTRSTTISDPAVFRQMRYSWVDPDGVVGRASLEGDVALLRDLGIAPTAIDLSPAFVDKYRQFAVQYLGEYQPPR
jgi:NitT/TauT family transport system substrate-binding protein